MYIHGIHIHVCLFIEFPTHLLICLVLQNLAQIPIVSALARPACRSRNVCVVAMIHSSRAMSIFLTCVINFRLCASSMASRAERDTLFVTLVKCCYLFMFAIF